MSLPLLLTIPLLYLKSVVIMANIAPLAWAKHGACQAVVLTVKPVACARPVLTARCHVHSCSQLFVAALDELPHFIWRLELKNGANLGVYHPESSSLGQLSYLVALCQRVWYKIILPHGNLEMFMRHVFIERLIGLRQWLLLWGTYQRLPTLVDQIAQLGESHWKIVCLYLGGALAKSKVAET